MAVHIILSMMHGHTNIKLLLLHLVGCLYYSINDARSHKYQIIIVASSWLFIIVSMMHGHTNIKLLLLLLVGCLYYCSNDARSHKHQIISVASSWLFILLYQFM